MINLSICKECEFYQEHYDRFYCCYIPSKYKKIKNLELKYLIFDPITNKFFLDFECKKGT